MANTGVQYSCRARAINQLRASSHQLLQAGRVITELNQLTDFILVPDKRLTDRPANCNMTSRSVNPAVRESCVLFLCKHLTDRLQCRARPNEEAS